MSYYLPTLRSQHDKTDEPHEAHRNNNCTCASAAMALDYHTVGATKVRPGDIRHHQPDRIDGTDLNDVAIAWKHYGSDLIIKRTGWSGVKEALAAGRCVLLPGKSARLDGSCSESQAADHNILVHPDRNGTMQRVCDPWCRRAKWTWLERSVLRAYFEALGTSFGISRAQPRSEEDVVNVSDPTPHTLDWEPGTSLFDLARTVVRTYGQPRKGVYSPFMADPDTYAVVRRRRTGEGLQLLYIRKSQAKGLVVKARP